MKKIHYNQATFLKSAPALTNLPPDQGIEVAFIGRSNAGKSSALNTITGIKGLARTSKLPGRTQAINLFSIDKAHRLVDLPGYGYAKVPLSVRQRWAETIDSYLAERTCLHGLVLVMDIRHPLKETDMQVLDWAIDCRIPTHILLTKADKLKPRQANAVLQDIATQLEAVADTVSWQVFSSLEKKGVDEVLQKLDHWFEVTAAVD